MVPPAILYVTTGRLKHLSIKRCFFPRLHTGAFQHNQLPSTWWMRDAAFLRLKNIEVGYEFDKTVLQRLRMENLRVYVQGNNVAVWDKD